MGIRNYLIGLVLLITACVKLDGFMFEPTQVETYYLDDYTGDRELNLPDSFAIADSMIHLLSYPVKDENVYAVYIGDYWRLGLGDTVILYCHGNSDHMDKYWNRAKLLAHVGGKHRYGVMMMDYRGFGASDGTPSESHLNEDVEAAIDWLSDWGLTSKQLVVYGYSMGSAPASQVALKNDVIQPDRLILENPFASADVMSEDASGLSVPISYTSTTHYDVAGRMKDLQVPLLWMHGIDDSFLNIETHGEVVFRNHPGPKSGVRVASAEHNNLPEIMGWEAYLEVVGTFIETSY